MICPTSYLSSTVPNRFRSISFSSDEIDDSTLILQEILRHSCTDDMPDSDSTQEQSNIDQYDNNPSSSIIADEFQPDFYYLCPVTNTTNFSKTDFKTLVHDF